MTDPELFVTLCTLHQTVPMQCHTNHMKKPFVKPTAANAFFMHVELDLKLYVITGLHIFLLCIILRMISMRMLKNVGFCFKARAHQKGNYPHLVTYFCLF